MYMPALITLASDEMHKVTQLYIVYLLQLKDRAQE